MIRQPVSRISFDRLRGFLGVHLQEGALFVDAAWNEGADISWSLLRDAILAGGLDGTAGRELRIEPELDGDRLTSLTVCGTSRDPAVPPRPFYANGLPVLWPADLAIDAQPIGPAFRRGTRDDVPPGGSWIDLLKPNEPYEIYLRARVGTYDRIDDPFLDDPGLDAAHGTFRKRVLADVRIRKAGDVCGRPTNIKLSVDGSYLADLNVLYRVELDAFTGSPALPAASVLWDIDGGATVARVVDSAVAGARLVMVDTTERFADGFVRFEGPGIGPELYTVVQAPGLEGSVLQVTRHRCDRAEVSLAQRQRVGEIREASGAGVFTVTVIVPPAASPAMMLALLEPGDLVTELPGGGRDGGPWTVLAAERKVSSARTVDVITLTHAGLAQPLATLDDTRTANLLEPAYQFDTTLVVADRADWRVGERISLIGSHEDAGGELIADTIAVREDRVIVRIEHLPEVVGERSLGAVPAKRMLVRLDLPLAHDHVAGSQAIPERPIRVRRFAGHACRVAIEPVKPISDGAASLAGFSHALPLPLPPAPRPPGGLAPPAGLALPAGLSIHLTTDGDSEPTLKRGHGWHFAARGDGWVETRLFAPVEEESASEVVLARLTMRADGHELVDLRPLPAALAVDDELGRIGASAAALADLLAGDPVAARLGDVVTLAATPRVQPRLVSLLYDVALAHESRLYESAACKPWLARLEAAINAIDTARVDGEPSRRELAAISFALGGLAYAFSATPATQGKP